MHEFSPPPLPPSQVFSSQRRTRLLVGILVTLAASLALVVFALVILSATGLLRPFSLPTAAMAPAISRGDEFYVESLTYLVTKPKRGDIIIFRTDGIPSIEPHTLYTKRLVGLPGDRLSLSKGVLSVNDQPVSLRNRSGEIHYTSPLHARYLVFDTDTVTVPAGQYFVLGDNSTNSLDSRYFGFLPVSSVVGRASFCYWPPGHFGLIQ